MKKLLMATGTAILFSNMAIAPAFANPLAQEIEPETQYQIVLPEGEIMTDTQLTEVEGEWKHIAIGAGVGAAWNLGTTTYSCYTIRGANCGWRTYAGSAAVGAVRGGFTAATFGYGGGRYGGTRF